MEGRKGRYTGGRQEAVKWMRRRGGGGGKRKVDGRNDSGGGEERSWREEEGAGRDGETKTGLPESGFYG